MCQSLRVRMAWTSPDGVLSRLLSGDPVAILIAFMASFSLPLLLHLFLYRASAQAAATPTFLLLGTSGAGKTSLLTLVRCKVLCRGLLICSSGLLAAKAIQFHRHTRVLSDPYVTGISPSKHSPPAWCSSCFEQVPVHERSLSTRGYKKAHPIPINRYTRSWQTTSRTGPVISQGSLLVRDHLRRGCSIARQWRHRPIEGRSCVSA
jgi:hypothetical protein